MYEATSLDVQLCSVETEDGIRLHGVLQRSDRPADAVADVILLIHGTGGNFYSGGVLDVCARQARAAGLSVLRVNTRGHDLVATLPGGRRGGGAYERVSDCPLDLEAWTRFLADQELHRIVLVGHSLGGVKAIYSVSNRTLPNVVGVAAISPPRLNHQQLAASPLSLAFPDDFRRAEEAVAIGRPEELLHVMQPLPMIITAGGFLEKYGPASPYDIVRLLPGATVPVLIVLGGQTVTVNPAFLGLPEQLAQLDSPQLTIRTVPGADIQYRQDPEAPFALVQQWLRSGR